MSQSINQVVIGGRLGQDPKGGDAGRQRFCRFSVATTRSWRGKDDEWQEKTEWHNVVVWGRDAEKCEEHLTKGSTVTVQGRIESREYESDGGTKKVTEIIAERVFFAVSKSGDKDRDNDRGRDRDRDRDRDDRGSSKRRDDDRDDDRRSSKRRDDDDRSSSTRRDDDRDSRPKGKRRDDDEKFDETVPF